MAVRLQPRRFTVDEYYEMARAGILTEDDRVELIQGEIVEMTPIGRAHAGRVDRLTQFFLTHFGDVAQIRIQNPIRLDEHNEPQPDLALLRPRPDFYEESGHPTPPDIFLLIEVAQTSAERDHQAKIPLYARAGIVESWVMNLETGTITVYRDPSEAGYRTVRVVRRDEALAPVVFPDREFSAGDILG